MEALSWLKIQAKTFCIHYVLMLIKKALIHFFAQQPWIKLIELSGGEQAV